MALVTSDFLANALKNFRTLFANEFEAANALQGWRQFTMEIKSTSTEETYEWLGTVPKMEELKGGDFVFDEIGGPFSLTITNLEWQAGFEIARVTFEDDKLGQIRPRIAQLAGEAARFPGEKIWGLFETPGNAFDGTAFFSDSRTIGDSANIDNIARIDRPHTAIAKSVAMAPVVVNLMARSHPMRSTIRPAEVEAAAAVGKKPAAR